MTLKSKTKVLSIFLVLKLDEHCSTFVQVRYSRSRRVCIYIYHIRSGIETKLSIEIGDILVVYLLQFMTSIIASNARALISVSTKISNLPTFLP